MTKLDDSYARKPLRQKLPIIKLILTTPHPEHELTRLTGLGHFKLHDTVRKFRREVINKGIRELEACKNEGWTPAQLRKHREFWLEALFKLEKGKMTGD